MPVISVAPNASAWASASRMLDASITRTPTKLTRKLERPPPVVADLAVERRVVVDPRGRPRVAGLAARAEAADAPLLALVALGVLVARVAFGRPAAVVAPGARPRLRRGVEVVLAPSADALLAEGPSVLVDVRPRRGTPWRSTTRYTEDSEIP